MHDKNTHRAQRVNDCDKKKTPHSIEYLRRRARSTLFVVSRICARIVCPLRFFISCTIMHLRYLRDSLEEWRNFGTLLCVLPTAFLSQISY